MLNRMNDQKHILPYEKKKKKKTLYHVQKHGYYCGTKCLHWDLQKSPGQHAYDATIIFGCVPWFS